MNFHGVRVDSKEPTRGLTIKVPGKYWSASKGERIFVLPIHEI